MKQTARAFESDVLRFWDTAEAGKSAALDFNIETGEFLFRATKSIDGDIGNGDPGIPYTDIWVRVALCINGAVSRG